jgi:hypothetical protein
MGTEMTKQPLKTGTRIEVFVSHPQGRNEQAKIVRWTKVSGARREGWHIVKFADGGKLCIHEEDFRVVDNRAA